MRTYIRQQTVLPERLARLDVAYMHLYHGYLTFLYRIAQRHTRMTVPTGIQHYSVTVKRLYLINQVAFVIRLKVH